jgi:hypothetical protein
VAFAATQRRRRSAKEKAPNIPFNSLQIGGFMIKRSIPSPAMVIACIALFVAMGGTGYAATQLASGKEEASSSKVKRGPRGPRGKRGKVGPVGPQGAQGVQGVPGSAKAYARVTGAGVATISFGLAAPPTHPGTGLYCINAGQFTTANSVAVVTPDYSDGPTLSGDTAQIVNGTSFNSCPTGQFQVRTVDKTEAGKNLGFTFIIG